MSSALSLIVLGNVYLLGANISSITPNSTVIPTFSQERSQLQFLNGNRRNDYTYTSGIGGHKVHTQAAKWNEARKTCKTEGGHLAIINSVAEAEVIGDLLRKSLPHNGSEDSEYIHAGFHDLYNEGEFVTILDESLETVGFNEWSDGEPNDDEGAENCGSIDEDGRLNDISCDKSVGFVCELPYVPATIIVA